MVAPFLPDGDKVRALREAIPGATAGIYLNTASAGPLPTEVDAAMRGVRDWQLRVGRGDAAAAEASLGRREEARGVLAALVGGSVDAMALTHGTIGGLSTALAAMPLDEGDTIVATDEEHPALDRLLERVRRSRRLRLARVAVSGQVAADGIVDAFARAVADGARAVLLPHVTWATGRRLPVERIAASARDAGAWCAVDGALAAGALPLALDATAIDFYAFPGHKWLLAPGGTGGLYLGPRALRDLEPPFGAGDRVEPAGEAVLVADAPGAGAWEIGGWDEPVTAGLARAVGWLEMYVGLEWAHERVHGLVMHVLELLSGTQRVEVLTPPSDVAAIVSFRIAGWPTAQVAEELRRRDFAILAAIGDRDVVRLSVGAFNTEDELERLMRTVRLIAAHDPETLPRRPSLVVLGSEA